MHAMPIIGVVLSVIEYNWLYNGLGIWREHDRYGYIMLIEKQYILYGENSLKIFGVPLATVHHGYLHTFLSCMRNTHIVCFTSTLWV